jgi:phage-related minor tail protein
MSGIIGNLMYAVGFKLRDKGLREASNKVGTLTKSVVGLGLAAVTAMAGLGVAGISAASEFETAMSKVQAATGTAAEQMAETRELAKNLYSQNLGEDWQDLGSAISTVQQVTHETGAELEKTTRNALLLRDSFGFEINESIKATDTMMQQFGVSSEQAMNLLAQGQQQGLDKSGDMLDTANEYANQFKSLGFSANEMFDTLAAGSANGAFSVDKVGDAVKEFNIRAKDGSKTTTQAFEMLGLNADKMMHTFAAGGPGAKKAFTQIMQMIADVEDPIAKNTIGVALLGTQFEDLEAPVIAALGTARNQFDMTKGSMDQLNTVKFDRPGEAFAMFKRQLEVGILIPIGEKVLPYLTRFGQWLSDHKPQITAVGNAIGSGLGVALDKIGAAVQWSIPYLTQLGQVLINDIWPVIDSVGGSIISVASAFVQWEGFLPLVAGLTAGFLAYKAVVLSTTIATKAMTIATKAMALGTKIMTGWQYALNLAMSLNPIGLIIAAVVGLGVALVIAYKKSETFRNIINGAWAGIKQGFAATMNFFKVTVPNVFNGILGFLKRWTPVILNVILGPIGLLVGLVIKHWGAVKAGTIQVFTSIRDWLTSTWRSITSGISSAMGSVKTTIAGAWNSVWTIIQEVGTKIGDTMTGVWDGIKSGIISAINWVIGKVNGMIEGINDSLSFSMPDWMGGKSFSVSMPTIPLVPDGSHANGLAKVPFDGYIAELHKDERVLTAKENKAYSACQQAPRAAASANSRHEVIIKIEMSGSAGGSIDRTSEAQIHQVVANTVESVIRRLGLSDPGAVTFG